MNIVWNTIVNIILIIVLFMLVISVNPFSWELIRFIFSFDFASFESISDLGDSYGGIDTIQSNNFWYTIALNVTKVGTWVGILCMVVYVIKLVLGGLKDDRASSSKK